MRTCTIDGCTRKHDARGLCKTHYNQAHPKRWLITCEWCGSEHHSARRTGRYCTEACRGAARANPVACSVPRSHPSRSETEPKTCRVWITDCAWCGTTFVGRMPHSTMCSKQCTRRRDRMLRRSRAHDNGGTYTWTQVMRLFILFDKRCAYCDDSIAGQPDPDHVIPLSRHGSNSIGNILPSCRACNADKRDLLLSEWSADRARRGLPVRRTTWDQSDARYRHMHAAPSRNQAA